MRFFAILLVALSVNLAAQTTNLSPDVIFLAKAVRHNRDILAGVSNFTCLETIDRKELKPGTRAFRRLDLVRLEVAKVAGKELFSWPGGKFAEKRLSEFAGGGLMGDGTFSSFADDIFANKAATMKLRGSDPLENRPAIRVDYVVGPLRSNYRLRTASGAGQVTYSGSFWLNPESLDILRLDVNAGDIPPELQLASASIRIEYGPMKSDEEEVLLTQRSVIELVNTAGEVHRDEINFTHCRKFAGDAQLVADTTDAPPQSLPLQQWHRASFPAVSRSSCAYKRPLTQGPRVLATRLKLL